MNTAAENTTHRPTFLERQQEAILAEAKERSTEHERVARIVLGDKPDRHRRITDVIKLGGDYLAEVTDEQGVTWTPVVGGQRTHWRHSRQEDALLHLIATRYDSDPNASVQAAFYAGRVLGCKDDDR